MLYNKLPTSTAADAKSQHELRKEVIRLKREMNATSSKDEFAKWAKIRRSHDKASAQYDEKSKPSPNYMKVYMANLESDANIYALIASNLKSFKATFDRTVSTLRWIGTNGLRFFLQFWYSKRPLFWIPRGWVPGYVEWLLAFPRAPTGSVSIQIWGIACATIVQLIGAAVVAGLVLVRQQEQGRQKMKMGVGDRGEKGEGKKEL